MVVRRWAIVKVVRPFASVSSDCWTIRSLSLSSAEVIDAILQTIARDFPDCRGPEDLHLAAAFTGEAESAQEWLSELEEAFPGYPIHMDPLSLSVACHIGPGARAVTVTRALRI